MIGKIRIYKTEQGYGFIVTRGGAQQHFFHVREWLHEEDPVPGDLVQFELKLGKPGFPPQASLIKKIDAKPAGPGASVLAGLAKPDAPASDDGVKS